MIRLFAAVVCMIPGAALAQTFDRPIPQAQSSEAEWLYFLASVVFIVALVVVQRLVARR